MAKKTWHEKLYIDRQPEVGLTSRTVSGFPPGSKMLIPTPVTVKHYIEQVPRGVTATVEQLRADLARQFDADLTCPMVASIFLRIVSEAALDDQREGKPTDQITPFWRVVDAKSTVGGKLSCGTEFIDRMRESET